jgi:hypothetical protein
MHNDCCHCYLTGEAKLREAQLELQLSTRKQAADLELAQDSLAAHRAALVSCSAAASTVGCLHFVRVRAMQHSL